MTLIVGVLCEDGVVIGSDSVETFGLEPNLRTIEQPSIKIEIIGRKIITASTGHVGLAQRFNRIVKGLHNSDRLRGSDVIETGRLIAEETINDFRTTASALQNHPQHGWGFGSLVAIPINNAPQLFSYDPVQFLPELKGDTDEERGDRTGRIVSLGSGQAIADPFLGFIRHIFWKDRLPKVRDGKLAVTWTLIHTIDLNTGGIGGEPHLAALEKRGRDWRAEMANVGEIMEEVDDLERMLGDRRNTLLEAAAGNEIPESPE